MERLKKEEDKMTQQYKCRRVETDKLRGDYLEIAENGDKIIITAYNHRGEIEEIIDKNTIKNLRGKN